MGYILDLYAVSNKIYAHYINSNYDTFAEYWNNEGFKYKYPNEYGLEPGMVKEITSCTFNVFNGYIEKSDISDSSTFLIMKNMYSDMIRYLSSNVSHEMELLSPPVNDDVKYFFHNCTDAYIDMISADIDWDEYLVLFDESY